MRVILSMQAGYGFNDSLYSSCKVGQQKIVTGAIPERYLCSSGQITSSWILSDWIR